MTDYPDGSHYAVAAEAECGSKPVVTIPSTVLPGNFAGVRWNSCCFQHRTALDAAGIPWRADGDAGSQWIPVSERMPEEDVRVLVSSSGRYFVAECFRGDFWETHNSGIAMVDRCVTGVTHWMPLPEPPQ